MSRKHKVTAEFLKEVQKMVDHLLAKEPYGPVWNLFKVLLEEIQRLKRDNNRYKRSLGRVTKGIKWDDQNKVIKR